jgi:hypothetical protein
LCQQSPGAQGFSLSIAALLAYYNGNYLKYSKHPPNMLKVVRNITCGLALFVVASASAQVLKLQPLTTFGTNGDGTVRPGDVDFLNSTGELQRGMAWNPVTGHLLVVCRTNAASPTYNRVVVMDSVYGTNITTLDLNSLVLAGGNGSFLINAIAVADDGAIYAANLSNQQTPAEVVVYRWASEADPQTFVFAGDPANGIGGGTNRRWGDTFAAHGAGLNTEVLMASRGTVVAIFKPTDSSMGTFTATTLQTDTPVGALGVGLCFGAGNTFWGTSGAGGGGPLLQLSYDLGLGTATTLHAYSATNAAFPATVSPIAVLAASNLLAGVDTRAGADFTRLYDISDLNNPPVLLDRVSWYSNYNNNIFGGAVAFTTNSTLYALDSDNGISAYSLVSMPATPFSPSIILQPAGRTVVLTSNVTFTVAADGTAPLSYRWQFKSSTNTATTVDLPGATGTSYNIASAALTNSGNYTVIVTNLYGAVTSSIAALNVVSAAQKTYDGFDYTAGDNLTGKQNPNNFQIWYLNSGTSGKVEAGNLTYPGLAPSTGNRFTWTSASMSERLPIGTNISGTLYFSFLLKIADVGSFTSSDTIAGFGQNPADTAFSGKLNITSNSFQTYQLALYKGGGTVNGAVAPNLFTTNDTVMVVGNYTFNGGVADDACNLWLNPSPSTFGLDTPPTPTIGPITAGTDVVQLSYFFFRSTTHPLKKIADELRVGYSWAEVTPLAPVSLTINQSGTNVVLAWPVYQVGYILQGASDLSAPTWGTVPNPVISDATNFTVTVAATNSARYFRLIK